MPPFPCFSPRHCLYALLPLLPLPVLADRHVAIRATAEDAYVESRLTNSAHPRAESYVFLEGQFFGGNIRDHSLERMNIQQIARILAPYLAEQNFLPAKETSEADLVIVVHWGLTVALRQNAENLAIMLDQANAERQADAEFAQSQYGTPENDGTGMDDRNSFGADGGAEFELKQVARAAAESVDYTWVEDLSARSEKDFANRPAAVLLGFSEELNKDSRRAFAGETANTLRSYLDDERYFVVLMAYDLRDHQPDEPFERVWVSRISVPSNGINFNMALARLGQMGADYFGTNQPSLDVKRAPRKDTRAEVEIGEPTVVAEDVL